MQHTNPRKSSLSLFMLTLSMLTFGTIGLLRRAIPLSSALIAFFRGLIGSVFLTLYIVLTGKKLFHRTGRRQRLLLMLSGAMIGLNWVLLFEAYNYTSVSVATLCYYMQPTIVILSSVLLLHEKMTVKKAACTLAALTGMILISGVGTDAVSSGADLKGILLGLGAACLYSGVVLLNMRLKKVDAWEKTVIQLACAALVLIPYLILTEDFSQIQWSPSVIILLLIAGIIHTGIAYALYFGSMKGLRTQTVALFSYIDPLSALILSAVFLHERLTVFGFAGAFLILGSAIYSEL